MITSSKLFLTGRDREKKLEIFRILEKEVGKVALTYAEEYCLKNSDADLEQVLELYKGLIIPTQSWKAYFEVLTIVELKKEYRRYTILLHPDKNNHPKAKECFQKIYSLMEEGIKQKEEENCFDKI